MHTYTITADQLASVAASRLQHLDHGDEAAADALGWVLTAEPSGWISVNDRMPEDGQEVMVCVNYDDGSDPYVMVDRWAMNREDPLGMGGPTVETGFEWDNNDHHDVSHWIPLPQPPEA
jgi:hypothetical protein